MRSTKDCLLYLVKLIWIRFLKQFLEINYISLECLILSNEFCYLLLLTLQDCKPVNFLLHEIRNTVEDLETLLSVCCLLSHELLLFKVIDGCNNGCFVSTSPRDPVFFFF